MNWPGITPLSRVCIRFDDYHQDIDHETWVSVLSAYNERGLRGVIGVVPCYHGERLSAEVVPFLEELQDDGWEIAQHGYRHVDVGEGRGGPLYDDRSEFCGLNYEEQERRVGIGRDILANHGLDPSTFIPPWHEYDRATLRALDANGFDCLNEGRLPLPVRNEGITRVPTHVPVVTPDMIGAGIVTLVRHPHLDDDPLKSARLVAGHESLVRTPAEISESWPHWKL